MRNQLSVGGCEEVSDLPLRESVAFEVSRPVTQHGQYDPMEAQTIYQAARFSFGNRWDELCDESFTEIGTVFDFMRHVPHYTHQARIITTYRHQMEHASQGDTRSPRTLSFIRDSLASSPDATKGTDLILDFGSMAFTNVVSTVSKRNGFDTYLFTLQPTDEVLQSDKASKSLVQLAAEQRAQLEILKEYNTSGTPLPDTDWKPGFPIAEFSLDGLAQTEAWKALSPEDHQKFNDVLSIASMALLAAVSYDVARVLHPSDNANASLLSFSAEPSQQLNYGPDVPVQRGRKRSKQRDFSFLDAHIPQIDLSVPIVPEDWRDLLQQPQISDGRSVQYSGGRIPPANEPPQLATDLITRMDYLQALRHYDEVGDIIAHELRDKLVPASAWNKQ